MVKTEQNASEMVLDASRAWKVESCRLHPDVEVVFNTGCALLRDSEGWILVTLVPMPEQSLEATNALALGACRTLRDIDVPHGLYVTKKIESRSTVLDVRHVKIERFGEEPTEERVAFENVTTHSPGDIIHLNAIGFFEVPGDSPLDWDSCAALPTEGNDVGSIRIANSLSGAVPSVAMLAQAANFLIPSARKPVDELADLLCRKPVDDAQITRKAILTFSSID